MRKRSGTGLKLAMLGLAISPLVASLAEAQTQCETTCTTVRVLRLPLIGTIYSQTECTSVCVQVL